MNLFNGSASSVAIVGTAQASSAAFQGFTLEYARDSAPTTWLTAGISLTGGGTAAVSGASLGSLSLTGLSEGLYLIRLTVTDSGGNTALATTSIMLDRALMSGWPQSPGRRFQGTPAVADLDPAFPGLEVVARDDSGDLTVWHKDGSVAAGWPQPAGFGIGAPAVGDLDGDGTLEIVTTSGDRGVSAFHADGSAVTGWPQTCGADSYLTTPVLADLDGDGKLDVIVVASAAAFGFATSPAVGDLDHDGWPDVVVGIGGKVCAWNHQGAPLSGWPVSPTGSGSVHVLRQDGTEMPGWPQSANGLVVGAPALGDLDGDGNLDVVVGSFSAVNGSVVHVWRHAGTPLPGWPVTTGPIEIPLSPALADLDGDGKLDVVLTTADDEIHAWQGDGRPLPGWPPPGTRLPPTQSEVLVSSPVVADIDGDGRREVVAEGGTAPVSGPFSVTKVHAFHRDATVVAGWPRLLSNGTNSSPALADVDLDGNVDLVIGSNGVYVWRLPAPYTNGPLDWLMFRHDNQRTGAITYCAPSRRWTPTGSMASGRMAHTATLLPSGKVLLAGGRDNANSLDPIASAVLYDPATGTFAPTGSMATARDGHTATLLANGKVLIAGGVTTGQQCLDSAELFDPAANNGAGAFSPAGSMNTFRADYTATLVSSGKILMAGGSCAGGDSAELYDPAANNGSGGSTWTGSMAAVRVDHTATLLASGEVLIAGGGAGSQAWSSAELFDPAANNGAGAFSATGSLATARYRHEATLLQSGKVLISGGLQANPLAAVSAAEVFDPASGTFTATGAMATARYNHSATLLSDGTVLIAGGVTDQPGGTAAILASAELYDPGANGGAGGFAASASLATGRESHSATLLSDGSVLVAGGEDGTPGVLVSAELYDATCQLFNTPVGVNVAVQPVDTTTGTTPIAVTFVNVIQAGTTRLTSGSGSTPPFNFSLGTSLDYELTTTATISGAATVCIDYSGTPLAGTTAQPAFDHYPGGAAPPVIVTSWDPAQNRICGMVNGL
jgi:hypothetical protein